MGAACVSYLARPARPAGFPAGHMADVIGAVAPTPYLTGLYIFQIGSNDVSTAVS